MKLRQGRFMVFVRRVGVFASCPHTMYQLGYTCMRLKEARKRYPWLCRLTEDSFAPLMIDPVRAVDNPPPVSWRRTRHTEKIRLNRLTRRRNRQHINDEDYDFRRVRINRWIVE